MDKSYFMPSCVCSFTFTLSSAYTFILCACGPSPVARLKLPPLPGSRCRYHHGADPPSHCNANIGGHTLGQHHDQGILNSFHQVPPSQSPFIKEAMSFAALQPLCEYRFPMPMDKVASRPRSTAQRHAQLATSDDDHGALESNTTVSR